MTATFEIDEIGPALGVQVRGIDLREPVDENMASALRQAYADRLLVLFRDQELSADDQVRAGGLFGPVLDEFDDGSFHSLVSNVDRDAYIGQESNDSELVYHSDLTNTGSPPWGLSLHTLEISGESPVTRFVNAQRAYENLSPMLRRQVEHLDVTDIFDYPPGYEPGGDEIDPKVAWATCTSTHPAVINHPRNGNRQVYCNQMWTNRVVGMDASDAGSLLRELFLQLYEPANVYEHQWVTGDLIVWDNIAVQHGRRPIPPGCRRRLRRVSIGEKTPELVRTARGIRDLARQQTE